MAAAEGFAGALSSVVSVRNFRTVALDPSGLDALKSTPGLTMCDRKIAEIFPPLGAAIERLERSR